jgi:hypothetical protein
MLRRVDRRSAPDAGERDRRDLHLPARPIALLARAPRRLRGGTREAKN